MTNYRDPWSGNKKNLLLKSTSPIKANLINTPEIYTRKWVQRPFKFNAQINVCLPFAQLSSLKANSPDRTIQLLPLLLLILRSLSSSRSKSSGSVSNINFQFFFVWGDLILSTHLRRDRNIHDVYIGS